MDDKKLVLLKNELELGEEELALKEELLNIDRKYDLISKVTEEITKVRKDTFLQDEAVQELIFTIYLTAIVKIISKYMNIEPDDVME